MRSMPVDIILFIIYMSVIGAAIGTFTGLVPGIHVNTLSAMMLASYPALESVLTGFVPDHSVAVCVSSCIVSASVVHSFVDYIPSVFIGAPDPDDVLTMLPGHRLLSEGRGMVAVRATAIGSCIGTCTSVLLAIPLQLILFAGLGDYFDSVTVVVLSMVILIMIIREKNLRNAICAAAVLLISGTLGLAVMDLDIPSNSLFGEGTILFPMLSGLFGIPTMIQSLKSSRTVAQTDYEKHPVGPMPALKGVLTGALTGWFPGITATTGAILSSTVMPERRPEDFISMTASIGSSAAVMMIVTLSITGKGRSGTMINVSEILGDSVIGPMNDCFMLLLLSAGIAALFGYQITVACGKIVSGISSKFNMNVLNKICLALIIVLVFVLTGPYGLFILLISAAVGFIPIALGIGRYHLTGCLIIPTLLTYLGIRGTVLMTLAL